MKDMEDMEDLEDLEKLVEGGRTLLPHVDTTES